KNNEPEKARRLAEQVMRMGVTLNKPGDDSPAAVLKDANTLAQARTAPPVPPAPIVKVPTPPTPETVTNPVPPPPVVQVPPHATPPRPPRGAHAARAPPPRRQRPRPPPRRPGPKRRRPRGPRRRPRASPTPCGPAPPASWRKRGSCSGTASSSRRIRRPSTPR